MAGPPRTDTTRTVVVGAGPAGLVAAATLARSGHTVRVLERNAEVGHRFAGDFQGLENWTTSQDALDSLATLGVEPAFDHLAFHEIKFHDHHLDQIIVSSDRRPFFHLIRRGPQRGSLDRSLLEQARSAGAKVELGVAAHSAARGAIVATGPRYADGLVTGLVFDTKLEDQALCIIANDLAPAGYAYLLIWNGRATLATCSFKRHWGWRDARDSTVDAFSKLVPSLRSDLSDARPFSGNGSVFPSPRFTDEAGHLFVGEAAGLQDPEWGFGLRYAMESGHLAARSIIDDFDYGVAAENAFATRLRTAFANRLMFEALPEALLPFILRRGAASSDLHHRLLRHCAPSPGKSLLSLVARRWFSHDRLGYHDSSCHSADCECVRCLCDGAKRSGLPPKSTPGRYGHNPTNHVTL